MPKKSDGLDTDEKLDLIVMYLQRMDHRDKLRTWGGFFGGLLRTIPIIVFVISMWYIYEHGDKLLEQVASTAAQQAAAVASQNTTTIVESVDAGELMKQLQGIMPPQR